MKRELKVIDVRRIFSTNQKLHHPSLWRGNWKIAKPLYDLPDCQVTPPFPMKRELKVWRYKHCWPHYLVTPPFPMKRELKENKKPSFFIIPLQLHHPSLWRGNWKNIFGSNPSFPCHVTPLFPMKRELKVRTVSAAQYHLWVTPPFPMKTCSIVRQVARELKVRSQHVTYRGKWGLRVTLLMFLGNGIMWWKVRGSEKKYFQNGL